MKAFDFAGRTKLPRGPHAARGLWVGKSCLMVYWKSNNWLSLLQDSLGGNSYTLLFSLVSPADTAFNDTMNTLQHAQYCKNVQNSVRKNVVCI